MKKSNGITLIALIITIIVMLVLVSASVAIALNGGLFNIAKQAVGDTESGRKKEELLATGKIKIDGKWYNSPDDYLNNRKIELPETIKVGDYINYTPDIGTYKVAKAEKGTGSSSEQSFTTETGNNALKWRILSIDKIKGKIEIVSEKVGPILDIRGANGYNHGVDILNDLCNSLYSKTINGQKVAEGRSINVDDINAKTSYNYNTDTYDQVVAYKNYGMLNWNYPHLYEQEDGLYIDGVKQTGNRISASKGVGDGKVNENNGETEYTTYTGSKYDNIYISVTNTYYKYDSNDYLRNDLGINTAPGDLINVGYVYWLGSRYVSATRDSGYASFGLRATFKSGIVGTEELFCSYYEDEEDCFIGSSWSVRPVVSLDSGFFLTPDTDNTDTENTYWDITF